MDEAVAENQSAYPNDDKKQQRKRPVNRMKRVPELLALHVPYDPDKGRNGRSIIGTRKSCRTDDGARKHHGQKEIPARNQSDQESNQDEKEMQLLSHRELNEISWRLEADVFFNRFQNRYRNIVSTFDQPSDNSLD